MTTWLRNISIGLLLILLCAPLFAQEMMVASLNCTNTDPTDEIRAVNVAIMDLGDGGDLRGDVWLTYQDGTREQTGYQTNFEQGIEGQSRFQKLVQLDGELLFRPASDLRNRVEAGYAFLLLTGSRASRFNWNYNARFAWAGQELSLACDLYNPYKLWGL